MGKIIYIIGMGPGDESFLTGQAKIVESVMLWVGYTVYVDLMKNII